MTTHTYSVVTKDISQEQIWRLMSDVSRWHEWDTGIEYTQYEGPFQTGTSFVLKPKGGPRVTITLTEVTPMSYFKDETRFPLARMIDEHRYEATNDGLKITSILTMVGPLAFVWNKLVMQGMVKRIAADIDAQIAAARALI